MPLMGRGRNYSRARGLVEGALHRAYRAHWPARLVGALGLVPRVRVRRHRIVTPRWPRDAAPLTIAFVSDLHAGPTTHPSLIEDAFEQLARVNADVVLLGGDYVFLFADYIDEVAARLAALAAPMVFAVMGNHDLWADDRRITSALEGAGARVLVNEVLTLPAPHAHVTLAGLDDPWTGERPQRPIFRDDAGVRVVLVHAPEAMQLLGDEPFEVAICGHTHGGHIALPGEIPIVAPGPLSRRFAHGRYDVGAGRTLIVSRGVGSSEVALRLYADPDIVVVELAGA